MKMKILAVLMALAFNAGATNNNPPNECGNHGNNCQPSGSSNTNEANSNATGGAGGSGTGVGVGVGLGVGLGGEGGAGGAGGKGGDGGNAAAFGGAGGDSSAALIGSGNSSAHGGDAKAYGGNQEQGQGQSQSNVGLNSQGQSSTNVSGSKSIAQMASENTNRINASSKNANQSSASGNTTSTNVTNNIGGDSTLVERNAPPVFLGALTPTSCGGGFNAGGSSRDGAGALGIQWVGKECRIRMVGDRFHAMGMVDSACEIYKTTKGFRDAAKVNPKLRDLDCTAKPAPAAVVVPVAPELAPRIPRG